MSKTLEEKERQLFEQASDKWSKWNSSIVYMECSCSYEQRHQEESEEQQKSENHAWVHKAMHESIQMKPVKNYFMKSDY